MSMISKFLDIDDNRILHTPTFCGDELKPRDKYVGKVKDEWKDIVSVPQRCALDLQTGRIPTKVNIEGVRMYLLSKLVYNGVKSYEWVGKFGQRVLL